METGFLIIAGITAVGAIAAMSLRNLVHCALCLTVAFAGLAALYLRLGAQFVGFAQILVYIGAVAILIVFAILLTRSNETESEAGRGRGKWSSLASVGVAFLVFSVLSISVLSGSMANRTAQDLPDISVKEIGLQLMTGYVLPLEVIALLLTAALIGAVLIAMPEKSAANGDAQTRVAHRSPTEAGEKLNDL
ncbi:MAG: NADH-quinone oxidoreductase subunit J [Verrucomicrobia bacterium]|nr:NADH-quinone oxidoreductase subunit J [Verrucomicrobiota bacterium]